MLSNLREDSGMSQPSPRRDGASPTLKGGGGVSRRRQITDAGRQRLGPPVEPAAPLPRSRLKAEELEAFRRILLEKREQIVGSMGTMQNEALRKNRSDAAGDLSMMPIHMADIGTDAYEQEFTIGLIENQHETLKEIDAALERLQQGTFGICEATHKPIAKARLKVKPWARYTLAYKRALEEKMRRNG